MNSELSCDRADALSRTGNFQEAARLYSQIIEQEPNNFTASYRLGLVKFKQCQINEALSFLSAALKIKIDADAFASYGLVLHAAQRFDEAIASFDKALAITPMHVDALNNRGITLLELKRFDEALLSFDNALTLMPESASILNNRGNALRNLNRLEEAATSFNQALTFTAASPLILNNLGNVLRNLKRLDQALTSFDKALAINPDNAIIWYNRANTLSELGRFEEALANLERALAINRNYLQALSAQGRILMNLNRLDEALLSLDRALVINPNYAEALYNRGNVLFDKQLFEEAAKSYGKAIAVKPNYHEALNNCGNSLSRLMRYDEALECFDKAIAINPFFVEALYNRGVVQQNLGRFADALSSYDEAIIIKPDHVDAINNGGNVLLELKRFDEARTSFEKVRRIKPDHPYVLGNLATAIINLCDWNGVALLAPQVREAIEREKQVIQPLTLLGWDADEALHLECAKMLAQDIVQTSPMAMWDGIPYNHDRIRVAYLSADFHQHATAILLAGLIEYHDRSRFEIIGISYGVDDCSELRSRLIGSFDQFYDVRLQSDLDVARLLHRLEVDIAVDLKGYTRGARSGILSFRPCPIQVNYLGYPGTMGANFIDYIIADNTVLPATLHPFYTEEIVLLPDCYQANDSSRVVLPISPTRQEAGLPDQGFVFCCFNNNWKITAFMFDIWMRLLKAVPDSVIWLLDDNAGARRNLSKEAASRGIDPRRLVFAPRMRPEEYLAQYRLADLFVDTLPYNAHTTASDALWMGLPLVTCIGSSFAGRVAASLLQAIGMPELIANDLNQYEALALNLARDATQLRSLQRKLTENRSSMPLFDTNRFRRHIENAYIIMWEKLQHREPPKGFGIGKNDLAE